LPLFLLEALQSCNDRAEAGVVLHCGGGFGGCGSGRRRRHYFSIRSDGGGGSGRAVPQRRERRAAHACNFVCGCSVARVVLRVYGVLRCNLVPAALAKAYLVAAQIYARLPLDMRAF
jgi:hypothetical protein